MYDVWCVHPGSMDMPKSPICLWQTCVRHWHGWDMAAFVFAGCWENFFFKKIYFWHGCDMVTKQQHQSWRIKIKGTVLLLPLIVHLDLRSPSLHLSFVACSLLISFFFFFFLFCLCFSLSLIFPDASCRSQSNPHAGRVGWVLFINIWLKASGLGSVYSGLVG